MPEQLAAWVKKALEGDVRLLPLKADDGSAWGDGYEVTRSLDATTPEEHAVRWKERVWIVRSQSLRDAQQRGLDQRLERAAAALRASRRHADGGNGNSPSPNQLRAEVEQLLTQLSRAGRVDRAPQAGSRAGGPCGRMGPSPLTSPSNNAMWCQCWRNATAIEQQAQTLGWRAYATNVPRRQLSLEQGLQCYADDIWSNAIATA